MKISDLTVGSLFAGIGGFDLGLAMAGIHDVRFQVEIDRFCRGILAMNYPNVLRVNDVKEVGKANLPWVHVLCGGYPCQGHSTAGKGLGFEDPRSGLWFEFARIIGETSPWFVCIENVAALIARGLDRVIADLDRLGYNVHGRLISAADVGAPHRRDRLFLVAYARSRGPQEGLKEEPSEGQTGRGQFTRTGEALEDAPCARWEGGDTGAGQSPWTGSGGEAELAHSGDVGCAELSEGDNDDGCYAPWNEPDGCDPTLADSDGERVRLEQQRLPGGWPRDLRNGGKGEPQHDGEDRGRDVEPGLGRDFDELPDRLDGRSGRPGYADAVRSRDGGEDGARLQRRERERVARWPAPPGEPQYAYEPPRSVFVTTPTRAIRLHALGNAIVPLCAAEAGDEVVAIARELGWVDE